MERLGELGERELEGGVQVSVEWHVEVACEVVLQSDQSPFRARRRSWSSSKLKRLGESGEKHLAADRKSVV